MSTGLAMVIGFYIGASISVPAGEIAAVNSGAAPTPWPILLCATVCWPVTWILGLRRLQAVSNPNILGQ